MIDTILLACDFSDASERALLYGLDLADRTGADFHFLHVEEVAMGPFVSGAPSPEAGEKKRHAQFKNRCRELLVPHISELGVDDVSYATERSGAVAPSVVQFAEEREIDLIVMGTQGRRGVQRVLLGSVAEEVLRAAPCPVLTARAGGDSDVLAPEATPVTRIVAPIDFSEVSREAIQYADRAEKIVGVAAASSDLVVMGTRGRSGLKRAMLGSVAEGVIRSARGPVIRLRSI